MADKKKNSSTDKQEGDTRSQQDSLYEDEGDTRSQQDSLYEDEGWEDADDQDEDDDDESDDDDKSQGDEDESDDDESEEDDDEDDEDDEEPVDDEDESDDDDEDDDESEDDEDDEESDDDWLPDWAPWVVLAGLILLGLAGGFGLLTPKADGQAATAADTPTTATEQEAEAAPEPPPQPQAQEPQNQESISASHLLVAYKGALRANPEITRSKEEAKARAEEALKKAKQAGADFAKLVGEYSDEPGAGARAGKLGSFTRNRMVKPFSDAAFKLKVGEISDVVETRFGFHVIQRTQ